MRSYCITIDHDRVSGLLDVLDPDWNREYEKRQSHISAFLLSYIPRRPSSINTDQQNSRRVVLN
jgi:hypothetical protein